MERNDLIERLLNPLWRHMKGGKPHLDDRATLADLKEAAATIATLSEALAEAEKKGAEDWQPIETAPRDGTEVILCFPTYTTEKVGVYRWRDVTGPEWEGIDGWSWDAKPGEVEDVPTHWRPLPAPPRDLSQGGQL